ncbi:MAG TPA: undecaprenyl-diphosphate phosphatase [Thermomicrobiales bacterium]|jgi:undecaprenyl-diphosphatase|nr:undecaprenyl-diphosphate phosphatase [Thermomicrobiales bacterium]
MPDWLIAIVLGIIEGLTEFVPVSSTGHLIVVGDLLNSSLPDSFEIVIQLGAILAISVVYRERFRSFLRVDGYVGRPADGRPRIGEGAGFRGLNGLVLLACATLPAGVLGFLFYDFIRDVLSGSFTVAIAWIVGGVALLLVERFLPNRDPAQAAATTTKPDGDPASMPIRENVEGERVALARSRYESLDDITWRAALLVGCCQCFALWPGFSRSASTIVGGMFVGISRKAAAEFSFFAAMPVMLGASTLELWSTRDEIVREDLVILAIGLIFSFLAGLLAVRWFVAFVSTRTMVPFGWYRIIVGTLFLGWLAIS